MRQPINLAHFPKVGESVEIITKEGDRKKGTIHSVYGRICVIDANGKIYARIFCENNSFREV